MGSFDSMYLHDIATELKNIREIFEHNENDKWITDRPPKDKEMVLITYRLTDNSHQVKSAYVEYGDGRCMFVDTGYGEMWYGDWRGDVIAWKPLPQPYKE